ncbi:hypothetical protein POM88_038119 [Heracleum sosnowskyi]|uniref:DUF4378 domain-containing protein n=1 Tax=Heracleum sosnowskyi TaxID=360622 RepID=A0AAD8HT65_9APIA|nr:hypothetical protein POM88_038119 [Heracleum sosnowskyi]
MTDYAQPPLIPPSSVIILSSINNSTERRKLGFFSRGTGNPVDDCCRCDPNWQRNRKRLADCGIGFGRNAIGGHDGRFHLVLQSTPNGFDLPAYSGKSNLIDKSPQVRSIARTLSQNDSCIETTLPSAADLGNELQSDTFLARFFSLESPLDPLLRDTYLGLKDKEILHEAKRIQNLVFDCVNAALGELAVYESDQWKSRPCDRVHDQSKPCSLMLPFDSEVSDPKMENTDIVRELTKTRSMTSMLKGRVSSLFFSRTNKSSKQKSSNPRDKIESAELPRHPFELSLSKFYIQQKYLRRFTWRSCSLSCSVSSPPPFSSY